MADNPATAIIDKAEMRALLRPSDARALFELGLHFAILAATFAMVVLWPNPLTAIAAIVLLGGRMQASGVISHDCAHGSYFSKRWANEFVGHWLAGAAINSPLAAYRAYHLKHHQYAGTPDDPDKWMVKNYPISRASLRRKIIRDITGQTGARDVWREIRNFRWSRNAPWLVYNLVLLGALTAFGAPWAYLPWVAARLFVYPLIHRLRQISEHGVVPDRDDPDARRNTGTTLARWWERLVIAPNHVNYHLEHHMFAAVPPYRLPRLHKLLVERGYYDGHDCIAHGFGDVLRRATRRDEPAAA